MASVPPNTSHFDTIGHAPAPAVGFYCAWPFGWGVVGTCVGGGLSRPVFCWFAACAELQRRTPLNSAITVIGNRHIGADMVRSHFHAGAGGRLDAAALDAALKGSTPPACSSTSRFRACRRSHSGDRRRESDDRASLPSRATRRSRTTISRKKCSRSPAARCRAPLSKAMSCVSRISIVSAAIST